MRFNHTSHAGGATIGWLGWRTGLHAGVGGGLRYGGGVPLVFFGRCSDITKEKWLGICTESTAAKRNIFAATIIVRQRKVSILVYRHPVQYELNVYGGAWETRI